MYHQRSQLVWASRQLLGLLLLLGLSERAKTAAALSSLQVPVGPKNYRQHGAHNYEARESQALKLSYLTKLNLQSGNYLESLSAGAQWNPQAPIITTGAENVKLSKRRPIMAGNWKLNPSTLQEATTLLKLLHANFVNHRDAKNWKNGPEVVVFPPFPFLAAAVSILEGSGIRVGAQNVALQTTGAFTGEVAVSQVASLGCDYVLLGHSERRSLFGETDKDINAKMHLCLKQPGLRVILCVGETEEEYESNLVKSIVDVQIKKGLVGVSLQDCLSRIVIAYEPVWAIGTGKVATPEQAQVAHVAVRKSLADIYGPDVAAQIRIQYGGSVKADNVEEIMAMPDVDGALVGGASLTADSFTRIVDGCQ